MAACAAAALENRKTTGRGCHVDASMYEICVQQMRPYLERAKAGERPQRAGNHDPSVYFQDVFPAAGDDRWVAISLFDERELAALMKLTGDDIAAWTSFREDHAIAEELQALGLAAGVVQDCEDMMERDPQLADRHALVTLDHPLLGPFGHIATPLHFSRDAPRPFRAPRMGEHGREVAGTICGLDPARIDQLQDLGVFE
jgi:crotonobetainyl-CoA:carnitine CoA-transferase CaiB-like acyl-CoA transferase